MFRHGDVFLKPTANIPPEAKKLPHCILAEGEATGHMHRILEPKAAELFELGEERYLRVLGKGASLVHQEHAPIQLRAGIYRVWFQREYSPKEIRRVVD
jgi:hypothetical protein